MPFNFKIFKLFSIVSIFFLNCKNQKSPETAVNTNTLKKQHIAIVIHGGAGTITKALIMPEKEKAYRAKLQEALDTGYRILENGGSSLDAVQQTLVILEDSPLFNAGKGAVFNSLGKNELDASIMDGNTLNCGAITGVTKIKNPINVARLVMDSTRHVMLSGKGAEDFAKQFKVEFVPDTYFHTETRLNQLQKIQGKTPTYKKTGDTELIDDHKYGTVGAVAIDKNRNIAAATSTGGLTNKKYGRIGDSPIIGAGTYANNMTCGVSSTGTGEYFIRTLAAHETSNLMKYKNLNVKQAVDDVINQIGKLGGDGGLIALDKDANIAWTFNTEGMFRGYKKSDGSTLIEIYKN